MDTRKINLDQVASPRLRAKLELCVAQLALSQRTINCLDEMGIITVNDLLHHEERELMMRAGMGRVAMDEVYNALELIGFQRQPVVKIAVARLPASNGKPKTKGRKRKRCKR